MISLQRISQFACGQLSLARFGMQANVSRFGLFDFIKEQQLEGKLSNLNTKIQSEKQSKRNNNHEKPTKKKSQNVKQQIVDNEAALKEAETDQLCFQEYQNPVHYPVLVDKVTQLIRENIYPNISSSTSEGMLLDCTLGSAGHTKHFLSQFPNLSIIGLDVDPRMIEYNTINVKNKLPLEQSQRLAIINQNFSNIDLVNIAKCFPDFFTPKKRFHCVFADLGYNSMHLDNSEWGFSYLREGKLDMRYSSTESPNSAADILNKGSYLQLFEILRSYGEDPNADVVSQMIQKQRQVKPFETTLDLANLILEDKSGYAFKGGRYRTITRVFQALRIAANQELVNLEKFMDKIYNNVRVEGIGIIITFHSLEEKIVEQKLKELKKSNGVELICLGESPDRAEIERNSKSRSAKLYVFKRTQK